VVPSTCAPGNHSTVWIFKNLAVISYYKCKGFQKFEANSGHFYEFWKQLEYRDYAALFSLEFHLIFYGIRKTEPKPNGFLPFYFHVLAYRAKNRVRDETGIGMLTFETSRKVVLDSPCLSVCLHCCSFFRALSRAKGLTDGAETLGRFSVMGHCVVSIFVAIRQHVYKIIF